MCCHHKKNRMPILIPVFTSPLFYRLTSSFPIHPHPTSLLSFSRLLSFLRMLSGLWRRSLDRRVNFLCTTDSCRRVVLGHIPHYSQRYRWPPRKLGSWAGANSANSGVLLKYPDTGSLALPGALTTWRLLTVAYVSP